MENLISFADRPKEEHLEISRRGGVASGKSRKKTQLLKISLEIMMLKDNLADTLKGFHFRNGNITEEQVRIFKRKYKEIARHNIRYKKIIGEEVKEDLEELKNLDYEELLREYAENKQEYLEAVRKQNKILKGNRKKWK